MKLRLAPGDRFKAGDNGSIWEYTHSIGNCHFTVCVKETPPSCYSTGDEEFWSTGTLSDWKYLGNFSKSTNFNNLYEKLNSRG